MRLLLSTLRCIGVCLVLRAAVQNAAAAVDDEIRELFASATADAQDHGNTLERQEKMAEMQAKAKLAQAEVEARGGLGKKTVGGSNRLVDSWDQVTVHFSLSLVGCFHRERGHALIACSRPVVAVNFRTALKLHGMHSTVHEGSNDDDGA